MRTEPWDGFVKRLALHEHKPTGCRHSGRLTLLLQLYMHSDASRAVSPCKPNFHEMNCSVGMTFPTAVEQRQHRGVER